MNPYTAFKFNFTFEVWLNIPQPDGATFLETFYKNSVGLLAPGSGQTYLYTKDEMPYHGIIKRVKDPSGKPVFEEFGADVSRFIISSEPVFDYQGNVNGYRQTLSRNIPRPVRVPE